MGYSAWSHKESDTVEATERACTQMSTKASQIGALSVAALFWHLGFGFTALITISSCLCNYHTND